MPERIDLNLQDSLQVLLQQLTLALPASWPPGLRMFTLFAGLMTLAIGLRLLLEFALLTLRRQVMGRLQNLSAGVHVVLDERVLRRAARVPGPLLVQIGMQLSPFSSGTVFTLMSSVLSALAVWYVVRVLLALLDALLAYQSLHTMTSPRQQLSLKSYVQLAKLLLTMGGLIVVVAVLIDRSPLLLLSGLGALSAVLRLVLKDTILSFIAGMQLANNDMLRVGDWIDMPQAGADGEVVDMALHAVKVQNWDKTITTIPTWRLMSESYRNWRGMSESGARRIKRTLSLDATSVHFLQPEQIEQLERIELLRPYLQKKRQALADTNAARLQTLSPEAASLPLNLRQLTNLGCFRAYVSAYLEKHPDIRQDMTQIVNTAGTSPEGVQVQIYCFSATTNWQEYETIQGDLFDHLLSVLPEFGLRVFQQPSGHDFRTMMQGAAIPVTPTPAAPASPEAYPVDATHAMPAASVSEPVAPSSQAGADISDKR